jgi:hypothetical protein
MFGLLAFTACQSAPLTIPTRPVGPNEQVIGPAEGSSTGLMLLEFIPINQNQRFVRAYENALASSGGTRLVDITIQERWFWAYILNGYKFKVTGTAVAEKK